MRFTYLTTLYASYVDYFYHSRASLASKSYREQKTALDYDGFSWNGGFEEALSSLGYDVQTIYANVVCLQKAWAQEASFNWPVKAREQAVAFRQIQEFKPEVLWVDDLVTFNGAWIRSIRNSVQSIRWVIGFTGVDFKDEDTIRACDAVLAPIRFFVDYFKGKGAKSFLFRHAFNPAILERIKTDETTCARVLFSGSIARGKGAHQAREKLLEALVEKIPVSLYSPQSELKPMADLVETTGRKGLYYSFQLLARLGVSEQRLSRLPRVGRAATWNSSPIRRMNPKLAPYLEPPVYGLDMFSALREFAVTFNTHIDLARSEAGNCRLFETTGVGGCLLTDWKENLGEMFKPDEEVVAYRNAEECIEKARWLLANPETRRSIARAGQARVEKEHTFKHRAIELDSLLKRDLT